MLASKPHEFQRKQNQDLLFHSKYSNANVLVKKPPHTQQQIVGQGSLGFEQPGSLISKRTWRDSGGVDAVGKISASPPEGSISGLVPGCISVWPSFPSAFHPSEVGKMGINIHEPQ